MVFIPDNFLLVPTIQMNEVLLLIFVKLQKRTQSCHGRDSQLKFRKGRGTGQGFDILSGDGPVQGSGTTTGFQDSQSKWAPSKNFGIIRLY